MSDSLTVQAHITNSRDVEADEVVQLYVSGLVGDVTRPVKELKGFRRIRLQPGESRTVFFEPNPADLAFYGQDRESIVEPGEFHVWIGDSSDTKLQASFALIDD